MAVVSRSADLSKSKADLADAKPGTWTLFVDESGDFGSADAWVVSGVLIPARAEDAELRLDPLLRQALDGEPVRERRHLHATELRAAFGHNYTTNLLRRLLYVLTDAYPDARFVATVNQSRQAAHHRERNYRLMLLDLIALSETAIPQDSRFTTLDLRIASRGQRGELWTSAEDIDAEVLAKLEDALEVDLASRGLVNAIERKGLTLRVERAATLWGTTLADFVANFVYNKEKPETAAVIKALTTEGRLAVFESRGGFDERRARIAERDGDHVAALCRWAHVKGSADMSRIDARRESMRRILLAIMTEKGTAGPIYSIEAYLEYLHRQSRLTEHDKRAALAEVEAIIADLHTEGISGPSGNAILFRLRNKRLLLANHNLDNAEAQHLTKLQDQFVPTLDFDPDHLSKLIQYQLLRIDAHINNLEFAEAYAQSENLRKRVAQIGEAWCLLVMDRSTVTGFENSHNSIATRTKNIECAILTDPFQDTFAWLLEAKANAIDMLEDCEGVKDRERVQCHIIAASLRSGDYTDAWKQVSQILRDDSFISPHLLFWSARIQVDHRLAGTENFPVVDNRFAEHLNNTIEKLQREKREPVLRSLLLREQAMIAHFGKNNAKARTLLRDSLALLEPFASNSPIASWLYHLTRAHQLYVSGSSNLVELYEARATSPRLIAAAERRCRDLPLLLSLRRVSPR